MPITLNGTTGISGVNGSAGTPALQGTDTNTGIFFGTDEVSIATGGSNRLIVDSSGRVGLGSSSPATLFEAKSTTTNLARIRVTGTGTTAGNFRGYEFGNGSIFKGGFLQDESTDLISIFTPVGGQSVNITSAGAVGIGVTPSELFHIKGASPYMLFEGTETDGQTLYIRESAGSLAFGRYAIGERARIDSSGRLLVGTSSAVGNMGFQIEQDLLTEYGGLFIRRNRTNAQIASAGFALGSVDMGNVSGGVGARIAADSDGAWGSNDYPGRLVFSTTADGASSPTERMRIQATGRKTLFSSDATHSSSVLSSASAGTTTTLYLGAHSSTGYGSGTISFQVYTNGNVQNTNNSYAGISDVKLKENIVDANSQWNDLKALQVRNYNFKEEAGQQTHTQIGLIAQEVELVSPGLVSESPDRDEDGNDLGTVTKSVNYSVLYMNAVKALQEAMERIETLEAKVAALEGV